MHSASWFNIYQYQAQCNSLHSSMWPYLYFYKWIRCYFLWVAMFLCYCLLAIVNTLKSLLGKINHWHRNMHLFFLRCLQPYNTGHLKSEIIKKVHCHSGPASINSGRPYLLYLNTFSTLPNFSWLKIMPGDSHKHLKQIFKITLNKWILYRRHACIVQSYTMYL